MIISRTPLRISLCGGGSDVPAFYHRYGGAVVSMAIDKYVYVNLNTKFDGRVRVSYSRTEDVAHVDDLQHELVRETLRLYEMNGVEISTIADIPGSGSGLGSSSALTVGMILAVCAKQKKISCPAKYLAENAYSIEAHLCNHIGTGKQDQYASAFGGFHYYEFHQDESVSAEPILLSQENKEYLESHLLLLWTGQQRSSQEILKNQAQNFTSDKDAIDAACKLRDMAYNLGIDLQMGNMNSVGRYLHEGWKLKRRFASGITSDEYDKMYDAACAAGAIGGKILGAGGGGFFLFFADPLRHIDIMAATGLRRVPFSMVQEGGKVVYNDEDR